MANINLLPWREKHRQKLTQQYVFTLVGVAVIVILVFFAVGQFIDRQISHQNARNQYLKQQIQQLDQQIAEIQEINEAKQAITIRMSLIEQLQLSRNLTAIIFEELVNRVPPGVSFNKMSRSDKRIKIIGLSESNNRLSDFMREIENSSVFVSPVLSSVVADRSGANAVSDFELTFSIAPSYFPSEAEELSQ